MTYPSPKKKKSNLIWPLTIDCFNLVSSHYSQAPVSEACAPQFQHLDSNDSSFPHSLPPTFLLPGALLTNTNMLTSLAATVHSTLHFLRRGFFIKL